MAMLQETYDRQWNESNAEDRAERLATALGWFSIGLGVAEVLAPSRVAQLIGVADGDKTRGILRAYGMREITSGMGILSGSRPAGWMWSRVAGDMIDLATLGSALKQESTDTTRVATATAAVLGVTALDVMCAQQLSGGEGLSVGSRRQRGPIQLTEAIVINRSPEEVYRFWHNFENLPQFMHYLEKVEVLDSRRSRWRANAAGVTVEWNAEIIADEPKRLISWRSIEGSDLDCSGDVRFEDAPGRRGTHVRVDMEYRPEGALKGALARLFGKAPEQLISNDLRRFKQIMEVGEVVNSDASIYTGMHPAQPSEHLPKEFELRQQHRPPEEFQHRS